LPVAAITNAILSVVLQVDHEEGPTGIKIACYLPGLLNSVGVLGLVLPLLLGWLVDTLGDRG
jgi:hypothetical protein